MAGQGQVKQFRIREAEKREDRARGLEKPEARSRIVLLPELYSPPRVSRWTLLFYLLVSLVLYYGWKLHEAGLITPKYGLGYALGIAGGGMMFLIGLYPIRKRSRTLQRFISTKYWFKAHMALGVLGPVFALIHTDFKLGSVNSRVVLFSTLLVAGSGFFGLYIYTRIHCSLHNRRLRLEELKAKYERNTESLVSFFRYAPSLQEKLLEIEKVIMTPPLTVRESFFRLLTIGARIRWTEFALLWRLRKVLKRKAKREGWSWSQKRRVGKTAKKYIVAHLNAAIKIAEFSFYERLFSLWHLFHVPLYFLLILTAIVHVVAVHLF